MYILDICNNLGVLQTIVIFKNISNLILIFAPIILLILSAVDLFKAVTGNVDALKKASNRIGKRLVILVIIFLLPSIVSIFIGMDVGHNLGDSFFNGECWKNANQDTIEKASKIAEAVKAAKAAAKEAARKKEEEELDKQIKKLEELRKETTSPGIGGRENYSSGTVSVENGVFFVPNGTSGLPGSQGSGPGGLNIIFYQRLEKYVADAKKAGHTIQLGGKWRSYEAQVACRKAKGDICATPGRSMHGWGVACDLVFGNKAAKDWAHRNAENYLLRFSVCKDYFGGVCKEDWHVEPLVIKRR